MELDKLNLMQELLLRYCGQRGMTDGTADKEA